MTNEQIEKYLKGVCTDEEAVSVQQFLKENPDHPYLLQEWEDTDGDTALPGNHTQEMFDTVSAAIMPPAVKSNSIAWKLVAAASLAGIIMITLFFLNRKNDIPATIVQLKKVQDTTWTAQRNFGNSDMELLLADGSKIILSPNAYLRYRVNFNDFDKREVYMTGKAVFEVAKNKNKPFVVYSQNISTTVLGTIFTVNAPENDTQVKVKLFEGKVWVALTEMQQRLPGNDYYLEPGQELEFNTVTRRGIVQNFLLKNNKHLPGSKKNALPVADAASSSYMFNNQTLADVLDQLSLMYGVQIQYSKAGIGNIYFIGKIDRDDSLDKIINDIAVLNKLAVKKQNGTYILSKKN